MSPAPLFLQQTISALLTEFVMKAARQTGGRVCAAPIDVILAEHTVVQPDLVYISKERREIVDGRINGSPDLVIEILSASHARRDRVDKLNLYAEFGVAEYWIVDPQERQFDFLLRNDRGHFEVQPQQDNHYQSPLLPELAIQLVGFWAEVDRHIR